ncbi:DUF6660 family protein [uncultured Mucilaginibacter sp.]|uniref:DUF6660 family protein n=1 Tax=Mucilaginibacter sp. 44-25 TaxID=1895794 RepID=UPI00343C3FA5
MKFWSLFMCAVILVLGLMPCKDSNAASKTLTKVVVDQGHRGANPVQDHCSPFCQCSCCNTPTLTVIRPLLFSIPVEVLKFYPELPTSKIKNRSIVIWQPPKLFS